MRGSDMLEAEGVALVNRGLALWRRGSREEAVTTMRQGIAVCRQLAVAEPAKINHLALALSNLGNARGLVAAAMDDFDAGIALLRHEDFEDSDEAAMLLASTLASQCGVLMHLTDYERALVN
ncbi:hypothetical protein ACFV2X_32800 [Streptomyces sp. NPDC059679]|uniref:hypothetical protein n=1 Tax=Streptomyces sp. NPDC059679 TaxID=3346903 RepID=UPI00368D51F0